MPEVYRELMSPLDEIKVTPKWPGFVILRAHMFGSPGKLSWFAVTEAGRPDMPYFWLRLDLPDDAHDSALVARGRVALDRAYAKAHPDGCPKIGH